jgi:MFS family permease
MLAFGVQKYAVILLIVLPTILYPFCNFAASWFFAHWRFHKVLYLASTIMLTGSWVRALSFVGDQFFWPMFLGTFIFFTAVPFILNSMSIVSNMWFPDNERARATAISGLMAPLGSLVGLGMTGAIAAGMDVDDKEQCMNRLQQIVYSQNIIFTVLIFIFFLLFREKPTTPPSKLALTFRLLS